MNWHTARRRAVRNRHKARRHILLVSNRGTYYEITDAPVEFRPFVVPLNGREQPGWYRKYNG